MQNTKQPKVFLFHEPLSNLDVSLSALTRVEISKLHQAYIDVLVTNVGTWMQCAGFHPKDYIERRRSAI